MLLVVNIDNPNTSERTLNQQKTRKTAYGAGEKERRLNVKQRQPKKGRKK